ncbi:hypothetical protein HPB52_002960 [Rhipicephalus sanguineus]|uniref:Uncharacterized protein n=1 Tax=Rhipicephalus sanguineus TaxID=34632 RepID=A0A9D4SPA2_RHISA|nr:hypothetical protein HPB52_002960 [Rhipicephalus sanguineus]
MLRIKPGSNILIVSTPDQEVAELVRKITSIKVNGRPHAVNAYVATGDGAARGVIHGLRPHTLSDTLKANLRIRTQNVEIIHARMLGDSKTAVITFFRAFVPKYVYYQGGQLACYPYKITVQVCNICRQVGHRTDVYPQPELHVFKVCGTLDRMDGHECAPRCATCGEEHLTGDRSCRKRLKPARHRPKSQKSKPSPTMTQPSQKKQKISKGAANFAGLNRKSKRCSSVVTNFQDCHTKPMSHAQDPSRDPSPERDQHQDPGQRTTRRIINPRHNPRPLTKPIQSPGPLQASSQLHCR